MDIDKNNKCIISKYAIIFACVIIIQVFLFYSNLYNSEYYILNLDNLFILSKLSLIIILVFYNPNKDINNSCCDLDLECNSFDFYKLLLLLYTYGIYIVYTVGSIRCIYENLNPYKSNNYKFLSEFVYNQIYIIIISLLYKYVFFNPKYIDKKILNNKCCTTKIIKNNNCEIVQNVNVIV